MKCNLQVIDLFEQLFIKTHNTLSPNGYNLQTGGTFTTHSKETCKKRSNSLKKLLTDPIKRKIWSEAKKGKKQKIKENVKKKLIKIFQNTFIIEKVNVVNNGYVVEHPNGTKRFGKKIYS